MIYRADEEYQGEIMKQLLQDNGLHPVLLDRKDDEFRIGQVELFISPLEQEKAKEIMARNEEE